MSWEKYELRHLCTEIIDCVNKTAPISPIPTEYKMLRTSDIRNGRVNLDNLNCVSYETFEKWTRRGKLQAGDIIFTREAPLGEVGLVKNPDNYFLGQRLVLFRANPQVCDNRFLLYALMYHDNKQAIIGKGVGSTVLHLRVPECEKITIKAPKLPMQHRIADILSAYDDLIENNRKQIKLLEEAAQRLYKEWFVDLRFPGHEHTKIVDGVPEGWEKKQADACFDITIGKTPPRAEQQWFTNGKKGVPWVSISDMGNASTFIFDTSEELTADSIERYNIKIVPAGTVLLSFKLTVGRVSISGEDMCTNEAIAHFRIADQATREYAYCYLKNYPYDTLGSTSSISKAINSKIVKAMPFVMPSHAIVDNFSEYCRPLLEQIRAKQQIILNLQQARDRLLPKLMSGEVGV